MPKNYLGTRLLSSPYRTLVQCSIAYTIQFALQYCNDAGLIAFRKTDDLEKFLQAYKDSEKARAVVRNN